ncbi:MAG: aminotransferase class III-fold pyridoxal phosphate-dependent enzyme, partial [Pseudomonadales bacterium]
HLPYNDIAALEAAVSDKTCAIIMEPLQGEGGINAATTAFAKRVRELCDQYQALLVMDEVQTGVGRLGTLYGYEQLGITPDILTSAKGLGNGFPVAAMLASASVAEHFEVGTHGSTYGGNPLACAIASKVLDLINQPQVLSAINTKSERFKAGLAVINERYNFCAEIRGSGLLLGCAMNKQFQGQAGVFQQAAAEAGLMVLVAGPDVIRMAPSLLIPDTDIDDGLALLEQAVAKVVG